MFPVLVFAHFVMVPNTPHEQYRTALQRHLLQYQDLCFE